MSQPLAARARPTNLDSFIGQEHLVGKNMPIRKIIESGQVFSMIFWGPPGVGKTTLARIIAKETKRDFFELSAVSAGKADIRKVVGESQGKQKELSQNYLTPVLFLDEIHRFNKAQQDYLLPYVEQGDIILIGATTENPSFEVISPLLSRSRVFILNRFTEKELNKILDKIEQSHPELACPPNRWVSGSHGDSGSKSGMTIDEDTRNWLSNYANGDARKLLTIIDNSFSLYGKITVENLKKALQSNQLRYDKSGEEHYNTISAFIKSMRASNIDAALYYLARMVDSGEDPKFIARRMVVFASEDIGLAQPTALVVANAVFDAVHKIGYPEAQINLAHGASYLCRAKKDRSAYDAYFRALSDVKKLGNLEVPLRLRNAPTRLMSAKGGSASGGKNLNYGKGYEMYPDKNKSLLPEKLNNKKYYKS